VKEQETNLLRAGATGEVGRFHPRRVGRAGSNVLIANRIGADSETARESRTVKPVWSIRHSKPRGVPVHRAPFFNRHTRRISLAALLLAYPLAATATAQSLRGWGPYAFDMTRSEAISQTKRLLLPGKGGPDLLDSARINGQLYTVELYFRGAFDPRLWKVQLHAETATKMDQGRCRDLFEKIAAELKNKYPGEEWKGSAEKARLAQASAYGRSFENGSTLRISETFVGGCDVNITYEAPPLQPIEGLGF
jgi:hypothetical protein